MAKYLFPNHPISKVNILSCFANETAQELLTIPPCVFPATSVFSIPYFTSHVYGFIMHIDMKTNPPW